MMNQVTRLKAVGALTALLMALSLIFSMSARADTGEACTLAGDCYTAEEYEQVFSVDGLVASGVFTNPVDNGDGTVTLWNVTMQAPVTVKADPLERPVAANPTEFETAPTVGEVLFTLPATANRLQALV